MGHGLYTHLCQCVPSACAVGVHVEARTALETGGGGAGAQMHSEKGRRGWHRMPAPAWERGTQSRPALSWVFILYLLGIGEEEPCLGGAAPPAPPSHPAWLSTSSPLFLCHCDSGAGRTAEGPGSGSTEGGEGHGGGLGPAGAPQGSLLPTTSDDGCK